MEKGYKKLTQIANEKTPAVIYIILIILSLNRESFFHLVAKNTCGQHYNDSSYFFVGVTTKNVQMFCFVWFNFINDGATIIFS